jgi:hypothetical protein
MDVGFGFEKERPSWKDVVKRTIFPSQNGKCRMRGEFGGSFKDIRNLMSLNDISPTLIVQFSIKGMTRV